MLKHRSTVAVVAGLGLAMLGCGIAATPSVAIADPLPSEEQAQMETVIVSTSQELYDAVNGYSSTIANRRIELAGDIALDHGINVYNCTNVVIDGNGFEITSADDYTTDPLETSYRLINVTNSTGVTFTDVTLHQDYNNNKAYPLNIYNSDVTLSDVDVDASDTNGYAMVINGSDVIVDGKLTAASSYRFGAINIDKSSALERTPSLTFTDAADVTWDFSEKEDTTYTIALSVEYPDAVLTGLVNAGLEATPLGIWYQVADTEFSVATSDELVDAVNYINSNSVKNATITLTDDIELDKCLYVTSVNGLTITGDHIITAADGIAQSDIGQMGLLKLEACDDVTIDGVSFVTNGENKHAIDVWKSDVTLNDVSVDATDMSTGCGIVINGSTVDVTGTFGLKVGDTAWGGINVDDKNGEATLTFDAGVECYIETGDKPVAYCDSTATVADNIIGYEYAGLAVDESGNAVYVAPTVYTVTFDYQLTNVENVVVNVAEGDTCSQPETINVDGYRFLGWFLGEDATEPYDFETPVTGSITLTARYELIDDGGDEGDVTAPGTGDETDDTTGDETTDTGNDTGDGNENVGGDEGDGGLVDTGNDKSDVTVDKGDDAADDATDGDAEAGDIEQTGVGAVGVTAGFAAVVSAIGAAVTKLFGRRK